MGELPRSHVVEIAGDISAHQSLGAVGLDLSSKNEFPVKGGAKQTPTMSSFAAKTPKQKCDAVHLWLQSQILEASMDDKGVHIRKLLKWASEECGGAARTAL